MRRRHVTILLAVAVIAAACSDSGSATSTAAQTTTSEPPTTATPTTATPTTAAPTTTTTTGPPTTTIPGYPSSFEVDPGSPVITPGDWDRGFTAVPFVYRTEDEWLLFYSGGSGGAVPSGLGRATSPDGITWTKDPDASISEDGIHRAIGWLGVAPQGDEWAMWYVRGFRVTNDKLYKATAPATGGPWTEVGEVDLPPSNGWDDYLTVTGVTSIDGTYWLAYAGFESIVDPPSVGILTSTDGETWERRTDPILEPRPGTWTEYGVVPANVIVTDQGLELFYMGFEERFPSVATFPHTFKLGRLVSTDGGETWLPDNGGEPILDTGEYGWPGVSVAWEDGTYYVYLGDDLGGAGVKLLTGTIP